MKIKNSIVIMFILSSYIVTAQNTLQIGITNLRNDKGQVSIELLDENNNSISGKTVLIKDNIAALAFKDLKPGKYALRYFHDENSNKKLDTNFLGIPKEGYGFSNNAYGNFGPKDFEEWLFEVEGSTKVILKTKY